MPLCGEVPRLAEGGTASGPASPHFAEDHSRQTPGAHLPAEPRAAAAAREGSRKLRECRLDVSCEPRGAKTSYNRHSGRRAEGHSIGASCHCTGAIESNIPVNRRLPKATTSEPFETIPHLLRSDKEKASQTIDLISHNKVTCKTTYVTVHLNALHGALGPGR